jgi:hypothetical protein
VVKIFLSAVHVSIHPADEVPLSSDPALLNLHGFMTSVCSYLAVDRCSMFIENNGKNLHTIK